MNQNPNAPAPVVEKDALDNAQFPAGEAGLTTTFDKSNAVQLTPDGPKGAPIETQDEFWQGVKNTDQAPREVASAVPTDVAAPDQTPEEQREQNA